MARHYHPATIQRALTCYALAGGNEERTKALLKPAGLDAIPYNTIRNWRSKSYRELYEQIKTDVEKQVGSELGDRHLDLAHTAGEIEALATEQLLEKLRAGEVNAKELARIAKDGAVMMAIHTDKHQVLTGKPTQIVQNDYPDLQKALERHGVKLFIEGEAEEVETPQIEEAVSA